MSITKSSIRSNQTTSNYAIEILRSSTTISQAAYDKNQGIKSLKKENTDKFLIFTCFFFFILLYQKSQVSAVKQLDFESFAYSLLQQIAEITEANQSEAVEMTKKYYGLLQNILAEYGALSMSDKNNPGLLWSYSILLIKLGSGKKVEDFEATVELGSMLVTAAKNIHLDGMVLEMKRERKSIWNRPLMWYEVIAFGTIVIAILRLIGGSEGLLAIVASFALIIFLVWAPAQGLRLGFRKSVRLSAWSRIFGFLIALGAWLVFIGGANLINNLPN